MPNGQNTAPVNPALLRRFIEGTSPDERSSLLDRVPTSALMPFKSGDHASLLARAAQSAPDIIRKAMEGWSKKPVNAEFLRTAAGEPGTEAAPQLTGLLELLQNILGSLDPATLQGLISMLLGMGPEGAPMQGTPMELPMGPQGPPMGTPMGPPMSPQGPPMRPPMGLPMGPQGPPMNMYSPEVM